VQNPVHKVLLPHNAVTLSWSEKNFYHNEVSCYERDILWPEVDSAGGFLGGATPLACVALPY